MKTGNKIQLFLMVCLLATEAHAQKQWTLEECIQYAANHNITIKQIESQKESAETNLNTSQMSRLPDLNINMDQRWNFGYSQGRSGMNATQNQANSSFSVNSSMPLFTGFRIPNEIARDKLELKAASENLEKAKEDLALRIVSLFLQVLFNKEIAKVHEEQLHLSQVQIEKTRSLVETGKVPFSQLYDVESQVAKDEVSLIDAKNNLALALLDLAQSLELETTTSFDIYAPEVENAIEEYRGSMLPLQTIYHNALNSKPVIKGQQYKVESAEKTLKIAQSGYLPNLSLNLKYATNYFYDYGLKDNTDQSNGSFSNQWKENGAEYINLSLNIPVFSRFSVRNQTRNAKFNINNQQMELDNLKKTLYKEIQTAYLNATAAQEKYKASIKAIKAAAESFRYAQERYEVGKSSVFEFNEAKTKLMQSQSEQIQAKFDYIFRAKILDFYNGVPIVL